MPSRQMIIASTAVITYADDSVYLYTPGVSSTMAHAPSSPFILPSSTFFTSDQTPRGIKQGNATSAFAYAINNIRSRPSWRR